MEKDIKIIKTSSYTDNLPIHNGNIKVAIKLNNWDKTNAIKTRVFDNAIYCDGFVSIDGGDIYYLGFNFLFHKLKRTKNK